jgi:hypothetical protein
VGDPVRERIGLAGAGTRDNEKRRGDVAAATRDAVLDRAPLLRVEGLEVARAKQCRGQVPLPMQRS